MIKATPINEGQRPVVLGVRMRRLGGPTLALSVPLDGAFYADITTRNTGPAVTKDFLAAFGTYDPATGGFTMHWGHIRTGVGVATGEAKNTVNCVAALAGTWDALGAIGTYDAATGNFTIESSAVLEDALTVEAPPPAHGELRNPVFPSEAAPTEDWRGDIDAYNVGGSVGTFRWRLEGTITYTSGSFDLGPGGHASLTISGRGPEDFIIYIERYDGAWVIDDSHHVVVREAAAPPPRILWSNIHVSHDEYTEFCGAMYWHDGLDSWTAIGPDMPAEIPIGKDVYIAPCWRNVSSEVITGHVDLTVVKPDGTRATPSAYQNQDREADPGNGWYVAFNPVRFDQGGDYVLEVAIRRIAPPPAPVGDLTYFDVEFYSDRWQILYKMHNRGDVSGLVYNALYDRDRGELVNDINGDVFHAGNMDPCVESPTYARVYRYNFPNSEWHLSFLVGHAENGNFVADDGVNFTLTKAVDRWILRFSARKHPGAGDPTNTIRVETNLGVVGRFESGVVGQWKEITAEIPASPEVSSIRIYNEDGSALQVKKYPTLDGIQLTNIVAHSAWFVDYGEYWSFDYAWLA